MRSTAAAAARLTTATTTLETATQQHNNSKHNNTATTSDGAQQAALPFFANTDKFPQTQKVPTQRETERTDCRGRSPTASALSPHSHPALAHSLSLHSSTTVMLLLPACRNMRSVRNELCTRTVALTALSLFGLSHFDFRALPLLSTCEYRTQKGTQK